MKHRLIATVLLASLAVSLMAGCTKDNVKDPAESGTAVITTGVDGNITTPINPAITTGHAHDHSDNPEKSVEEIKEKYEVDLDHSAILLTEKTQKPIKYTGFDAKFFETSAKTDDIPLVSVTPIYSNAAITEYIQKNSNKFDFTYGASSFSTVMSNYSDSFFDEKALIIVSFKDADGGSGYKLTGAWDDHIHVEDTHLDQLILAVKKSEGTNKCGHMIVEVDSDFLSLWDSISISLYE